MTTQDLINRLRDTASKGVSVWGDLQMEAAKEIETLLAERECYASAMDRMQAALAEPSEAVAEVAGDYNTKHIIFLPVGIALEVGDKLFTHPASKPEPSEADDTSCPTCGEDGGTSCGMPNCGLLIGESDVEPQNEPVAWQLGHRFYTSLKDAEYAWRNDCAFLGTSYVPEPLFTHPASKPEPSEPDCSPNHLCNGRMVHLPNGEQCDKCGETP